MNHWIHEPGWLWKSSVVIFLGLRNLCNLIDLSSLYNLTGLTSLYSPNFSKNFLILMFWTFLAPKWTILVLFCEMDHQKSNFLLIFGTLSVKGCWGQSMLLSWKLVDKIQMPHTQKYTDTFIITYIVVFSWPQRSLLCIKSRWYTL